MLCNDRIIKKIWWQKKEILYKDIEKIIINASYFDAYKIGKAINGDRIIWNGEHLLIEDYGDEYWMDRKDSSCC